MDPNKIKETFVTESLNIMFMCMLIKKLV